ncbi:Uu.00g065990.m01.CDS01 [Anthostomella pinea]|uniref:Uu.00g065990.m01.CDS01 n=1 Tax=Anthostomella pinea TaxID=933095 RepID=A0AAI8VTX0_9PEZI|nr:Uu.00g065990.m01.CDS01 [Anthostomella pinea]
MNKNWNDRADKDLFFTILSVKNIGVISGGEWTTIGNHMRSMGYGFTNEGCRQHFQGLRRAQHKAESSSSSNGSILDSQRQADPTANPITRRPGPGRGRPRKQPPAPIAGPSQKQAAEASGQASDQASDTQTAAPLAAMGMPMPMPMQMQAPADMQETDSLGVVHEDTELDGQPSKRQRIDEDDQQPNDDEAVLALAADGLPGHYEHSEYYEPGEA